MCGARPLCPPVSAPLSGAYREQSSAESSSVRRAAFVIRRYHWLTAPLGGNAREGIILADWPTSHQQRGASTGSESMKHCMSALSSQVMNSATGLPCQSLVVVVPETLETRGVLQISLLSQIAGPSLIVHWPDPGLTRHVVQSNIEEPRLEMAHVVSCEPVVSPTSPCCSIESLSVTWRHL